MRKYSPLLLSLCLLAGLSGAAIGQAKNNVPDVIPGAPKVTVEHIKVHGASLEGNLEGDSADRDVLVFLPPSYGKERKSPLSRRLCPAWLFHRRRAMEPGNPCAPDHRRRLRQGREGNDRGAARFQDGA